MFFIYSLLFTLGIIVAAPYYLWRLRGRITSTADWAERLGILPQQFQQTEQSAIWVHAVSVGETLAIVGLVREIQQRYPRRKIFLSHVTTAGREVSAARLPDVAGRFLLPLDWPLAVRGAIRRIRPAVLVITETELWPHLLRAARRAGTRVLIVNGRISDRSFRRYRWIRPFMRRVLEELDGICAQSRTDAERFCGLGMPSEKVVVSGNLKFDASPPRLGEFTRSLGSALREGRRSPVVIAASTMAGEEESLLTAWAQVRSHYPKALLILAPRHPARFEEVASLLTLRGLKTVRRTALGQDAGQSTNQTSSADVLLLDTIGELASLFELADLVFMGGSLVPTGGHNVLEPAYWGKAILFGPHMHNFRDITQLLLERQAALQISDKSELARTMLELLADEARRQELGAAARRLLEEQRGATERVMEVLEGWLAAPAFAANTRERGAE
jgi:3-deoxy-D-manno-octulosonic-acid transferase